LLSIPLLSRSWMASTDDFQKSTCVMVGLPYDGTCSYRPGTRFAPELIRIASYGLETYSHTQGKDLENIAFFDAGEIDFPLGNREATLELIEKATTEVLRADKKWIGIGGEHLVTFPAVKTYAKQHPNLKIVHFDAHADLREDYLGEKLSHACVIRRISEIVSPENIVQVGIRSGTKEEYDWMKEKGTLISSQELFIEKLKKWGNSPIFVTLDIDILDPSILSGTGTPEPGGFTYKELISWLLLLQNKNIVGADILELSPNYDNSGVSTITTAKIIREMLLLMN